MASRTDMVRLVAQFRQTPVYRDYVVMLQVKRDDAVHKILYDALDREANIGEARAYDILLNLLVKNENS
jgi:hypothetical protein